MAACKYNIYIYLTLNFLCSVFCELNLNENEPCVTGGVNGTCVIINRCFTAYLTYLYANAGFADHGLPELPDICSLKDNELIVCCTDCYFREKYPKLLAVGPFGLIHEKDASIASQKCFEYFGRLPYLCRGYGSIKVEKNWDEDMKCHSFVHGGALGIGGRDAQRWEIPHGALIGYGEDAENAQWLCGGSVISERFILTAAHCTSTHALGNITFAALGLLKRTDPKEYWKIYKIKRIIIHPDYKAPSKYHDIALLETETEINFGKDLLPACLDLGTTQRSYADASGWGRLGNGQAQLADTLQVVELREFSESECAGIYRPHRHLIHGYDHEKQMCYGRYDDKVDTCEGDSGGPLQVNADHTRCLYHIVGVTSYGKDCGILGSAGMYTRVSYYVPWIEGIVWPEETEAKRKKDEQWLQNWLGTKK